MKFILASIFVLEVFCKASNKHDFDITKGLPLTTYGLVPIVPDFKTEVKNYTGIYPSLHFTDKDYELIRAKVVDPKVFRSLLVENTIKFDVADLSIKAPEVNSEILSLAKIVREGCVEGVNNLFAIFKNPSFTKSSESAITFSPRNVEAMAKFTSDRLNDLDNWFHNYDNFPSYINTLFLATRPAYTKEFANTIKMFIDTLSTKSPKEAKAIKDHMIALQTKYSFFPDVYYNTVKDLFIK